MFINGQKYGHAPMPLNRPGYNATTGDAGSWSIRPVITSPLKTRTGKDAEQTQEPPFIFIGCHRNADLDKYVDYGEPGAMYDELAFWDRRLVTNQTIDETM